MALSLAGTLAGLGVRHSRAGVIRLARRPGDGGAPPTDFDPLDPEVVADPYPSYRELLRSGVVHHNPKRSLWIVSGYREVRAASRAHESLSSAEGVTRYRSALPMMLTMDRPGHSRLRRLAAGHFTRDALARWRPDTERLAREAVARMLGEDDTDAVAQVASPLPVAVIAHLLGVPSSDLPRFRQWSDRLVEGFGSGAGAGAFKSSAHVLGSAIRLHSYFLEQIERRRVSPGSDLLSQLVGWSEDGQLTETELVWFALMLLVAGNETTTNLLGTMLLNFAENPAEYARVRRDPALVPAAVEESLRYVSPVQGFHRTALRDYEVGGATIPAGSRVLLLFGAANRDPRQYPDPDSFRVERNPSDHLAFGSGIHFCLGAHLARLEATIVLGELVSRVAAIEPAGPAVWNGNPTLRGLARLPLRLRA